MPINPRPSSTRVTAACTEATLWVTRVAPIVSLLWMIGTAVASSSLPSVRLGRCSWIGLPARAARISGRAE